MPMTTEQMRGQLLAPPPAEAVIPGSDLLSTGSYLLNIACTDRMVGGFPRGKYINLIGDSDSGKTFTGFSCAAESRLKPAFAKYRIIYDAAERRTSIDIARFFGPAVAADTEYRQTRYVEDFYRGLDDDLKGPPFIYLLDSENALESKADYKKFIANKNRAAKGDDEKGSYGTKPKIHSANLLRVCNALAETGSILIIISQTRDRIGFGAKFDPKTRSGGTALKFYADLEIWTSVARNITKTVLGKPRQIGIICRAKVKKNHITGKKHTVEFPIYWSVGIDNTGSLVDYLVDEGYWKAAGKDTVRGNDNKVITAPEFNQKLRREKLVEYIEGSPKREKQTRDLVRAVWREIEAGCTITRRRRYI